jgi:acylphosphatase
MIARKFLISGDVQGVGYRFFAQRAAARHQVTGYIRNLDDGRVEAWVEGTATSVNGFRMDLQAGPVLADVRLIEETVIEPSGHYPQFRVEK